MGTSSVLCTPHKYTPFGSDRMCRFCIVPMATSFITVISENVWAPYWKFCYSWLHIYPFVLEYQNDKRISVPETIKANGTMFTFVSFDLKIKKLCLYMLRMTTFPTPCVKYRLHSIANCTNMQDTWIPSQIKRKIAKFYYLAKKYFDKYIGRHRHFVRLSFCLSVCLLVIR